MPVHIPFEKEMEVEYGRVDVVAPNIRRVVARNPSAFTCYGTGTYIVGHDEVAVIDPGPLDAKHIDAILNATRDEVITHILITHTHMDHSPGARLLLEHCEAVTYGFGPHGSRDPSELKVEEGADFEFVPDQPLVDGASVEAETWSIECMHTPGHTSNHVCFRLRGINAVFTGDHIMGWSTSVISPPDGNMEAYMLSLYRMLDFEDEVYWPTHGPPVADPHRLVRAFIAHRREREQQVLTELRSGVRNVRDMVPRMYADVSRVLYPAAARSVLATVEYLVSRGEIAFASEDLSVDSELSPV